MNNKNITTFLQVLAKYCIRYLDEKDAEIICNCFLNNYSNLVRVIKNEEYLDVDIYVKIDFIFSKIKADVFEHKIKLYYDNIPYDGTNIKQIDFKEFCLECYDYQNNEKSIVAISFENKILEFLLPPHEERLFNPTEANNENVIEAEHIYAILKKREPEIIKEYGKSFREFGREDFDVLVNSPIRKTSSEVLRLLWVALRTKRSPFV